MQASDLSAVEEVVRGYAEVVAKRHGINKAHFELHLVVDSKYVLNVIGGPIVKIVLLWPHAQPNINTLLGDAFALMRRHPIRRTMEIVPVAYVRTESAEIKKKWRKEKFTDESDIILDLIPRSRLRVKKTETTVIEDIVTGESITLIHEYPTDRFDSDATSLWLRLSRIVRDKHPEVEEAEIVNEETPLLDAAKEVAE